MWIRGHGSEVTPTPYHFRSDFHLQLHACRSVFVVLFPRFLHINMKLIAWYLLHRLKNIFSCIWWFYNCFGVRMQPCHFFVTLISGGLQGWTAATCLFLFQEHSWLIGRSNHIYPNGYFENLHPVHNRTAVSKEKLTAGIKCIRQARSLSHHGSWTAMLTSAVIISLTLHWRLAYMSRETFELRHNHYQYHCPHPVYYQCLIVCKNRSVRMTTMSYKYSLHRSLVVLKTVKDFFTIESFFHDHL